MATLQEFLSNPENKAGFFNPDTGEYSFSNSHDAASKMVLVKYIQSLQTERESLLAKWDAVEKDEMGEQRRPKVVVDPKNPEATVIKGKSGEDMVSDARDVVAPELQKITDRVNVIDSEIARFQERVDNFKPDSTTSLRSGMFLLSEYGGQWHILTALPAKLNTPLAKQFLLDMQALAGNISVVVRNVDHILDERGAKSIDSFVDDILQKNIVALQSLGFFWLRRGEYKGVSWK